MTRFTDIVLDTISRDAAARTLCLGNAASLQLADLPGSAAEDHRLKRLRRDLLYNRSVS